MPPQSQQNGTDRRRSSQKRRAPNGTASKAKRSKSTSSPTSAQTSLFFTLPRELRDSVYHELWKTKDAFVVRYGRHEFKIYYGDAVEEDESEDLEILRGDIETVRLVEEITGVDIMKKRKRKSRNPPMAPWICASKQFLHETIEQFQRQCTWVSNYDGFDQVNEHEVKLSGRWSHFLLVPWMARTLRFESQRLQELFKMNTSGRTLISQIDLYDTYTPCLKFLSSIVPEKPQLRRLEIGFGFVSFGCEESIGAPIEVDLRPLRVLHVPSLVNVVFTVDFEKVGSENESLVKKMREELSALGMMLIGGVGSEKVEIAKPEEARWTFSFTKTQRTTT
ncbi:hypothetical protein CC86DRAFT_366083 [Ophiobolus disseminans]|uniref:Uncharacterized protein n=1 Tax=Ophiobolus disseminans TaxID=1469910 RepID=A0A6A7AHR5_9PLEO|nr:hypothetical protein CC86DRAFT_366083 [Ophiobolus disseminans]